MKKLLLLLLPLLFINCATAPSEKIPTSLNPNSNDGMIVGTIAFENEKPIFNQYFLHYKSPEDQDISTSKMITIRPQQTIKMKYKPDFFDQNKAVYLFAITQIKGKYTFTTLRLHENGVYIQRSARIPLNIDFEVEKGKIKYIGQIYFNFNQGIITLSDEKERDLPVFKEKFPTLKIEYEK